MQMILDGRLPIEQRCWSETRAAAFVTLLARETGLHIIAGPFTASWRNRVQAFAIIAESHVAVEIDTETGEAHVDVFSCARLRPAVARIVFEELKPKPWKLRLLRRGELTC